MRTEADRKAFYEPAPALDFELGDKDADNLKALIDSGAGYQAGNLWVAGPERGHEGYAFGEGFGNVKHLISADSSAERIKAHWDGFKSNHGVA